MREILFKAKRMDNGEWVEGVPTCPTQEPGKCYMVTRVSCMDERFGYGNRGNVLLIHDAYEIDPKTVCQYTGLTDKNGNKIFECDVVNVRTSGYSFNAVSVKWSQGDASWCFCCENGNRFMMLDSFLYEIIGNIHDKEEMK